MNQERFSRFLSPFKRHRTIPVFSRTSLFFKSLSSGDKLISGFLGLLVIATSLVGLAAFLRTLQVEVPGYGGTLTEGEVGTPRFVNPLLAINDADRDLATLTYAGLMGLDGAGGLTPVLAESYTVSNNGTIYTFTLRANAKFSDGTFVTADDVVYTVGKAQDPKLKSPEYANWANIRAEVIDARTVRFTLPKAYAPFLEDTTLGILPAHLWRQVSDEEFPFSPLMQQPVGAGPFAFNKAVRAKDNSIVEYRVVANKRYVLGRPFLNGLTFKFYESQEEVVKALKSRAIESAYGVTAKDVRTAPYASVFGVFFNPAENAAFGRLEVRKALSVSLDRTHLVNDLLGGYATALLGPVPPGSGIEEPALPSSSDPVAAAKAILTNAGWTYDADAQAWKNAKVKLTLDGITLKTSNVPELKVLATVVQEDWQKLGIPVSIELSDPNDLTQNVIRPRKYEALLFGMVVGRGSDLFAFWDSGEREDPGLNIANYSNKTVDGLLAKARTESDPGESAKDLQRISDLIAADYPAAFTHAPDFLYAVPNSVRGVRLPQITSPSDRFATVATWYRETEFVWPYFAGK